MADHALARWNRAREDMMQRMARLLMIDRVVGGSAAT